MSKKNLLVLLLALSCGIFFLLSQSSFFQVQSAGKAAKWPSRRELFRNVRQAEKMLFIYSHHSPEGAEAFRRFAARVAESVSWLELVVKPDSLVTADELASMPLFLIGPPSKTSTLQELYRSLPFRMEEREMAIPKLISLEREDLMVLSYYPNPMAPHLPLSIVTALDEEPIRMFVHASRSNTRSFGEFRVKRDGMTIVFGRFKQEDNGPWKIDYDETRDYSESSTEISETEHYLLTYHGNDFAESAVQASMRDVERQFDELTRALDLTIDSNSKIQLHLYGTAEDKGLLTGNTDLSHLDRDRRQVHTIYNATLQGMDFFADAKLLLDTFVKQSSSPAIRDGFAMVFSHKWRGLGYKHWASTILASDNLIPLQDLFDAEIYQMESYLFTRALAGSFVDYLATIYSWTEMIELYKDWPESGLPSQLTDRIRLPEIESGWKRHLETYSAANSTTPSMIKPEFQRGFCYAHEGYQIYNGYLGRKSAESLRGLQSLGTDWISITPFGYLKNRNHPGYLHRSNSPGSENDESVLTAFYTAKTLGMKSMLKPHVLLAGMNFGWPGEVEMKNEADWKAFFKSYNSWIRHYALLAEMYDMDMLCIGVELLKTTAHHQDEWRKIIAGIRKIYGGPLVYAANWWQEFEQITFWDDLDYIGLNCYYPLSKQDNAGLADLKRGVQEILPLVEETARKYGKPVLLTEVGFASRARTWQSPNERMRGSEPYLADQELCYRAMFESFWEKDWFYGFYWWKWPTYLEYGGRNHSGFTPNGKPAETVVRDWYLNKRPASVD